MSTVEQLSPFRMERWDGVFPIGNDSLALGEFATLRPRFCVCDLGTGSGLLLLLLRRREPLLKLCGIDIQQQAASNAQWNLRENGLEGEILCGDLRAKPFEAGAFDLVVSNPPYFEVGRGASGGLHRSEESCTLEELCRAAARLTQNGGRFALCHRAERLTDLLCCLRSSGLEPKRMQLLTHDMDKPPYAVLVESVRQGKPGLTLLPTKRTGSG